MKKHPDFSNLHVADHPLILHKLSLMRDKNCPKVMFRMLLKEIGMLMGYELTKSLPLTTRKIETPMAPMDAPVLDGEDPVIVPILRAGLGMVEGLETVMPQARVGHIGMYRKALNDTPPIEYEFVEYLAKLPAPHSPLFVLVDPMLATGMSAKHALDVMVRHGIEEDRIKFMVLVAVKEGVQVIQDAYPKVPIYTAALDDVLDERKYILPGLGDAGDRLFGTEHA
ncbi:MAG: uracil phosphoribosyltransferase [Rhodospirillales bacterium]|nr:uracil phosphoribosyltransferase [Rhodospirillales bacterium]MCB9995831.1 uracil phosphoribosyltransferase [Rhodospirillales bacterium]